MESDSTAAQIARFIIGVAIISTLAFLLFGCATAPPKGPPATTPIVPTLDMCVETDPLPSPGSCGMQATKQGYRCVVCGSIVEAGCVDLNLEYCVDPQMGCDDPRCK